MLHILLIPRALQSSRLTACLHSRHTGDNGQLGVSKSVTSDSFTIAYRTNDVHKNWLWLLNINSTETNINTIVYMKYMQLYFILFVLIVWQPVCKLRLFQWCRWPLIAYSWRRLRRSVSRLLLIFHSWLRNACQSQLRTSHTQRHIRIRIFVLTSLLTQQRYTS